MPLVYKTITSPRTLKEFDTLYAMESSDYLNLMTDRYGSVNESIISFENFKASLSLSVSVKDYGAYGDDIHDDTEAIQSAINAAVALGRALLISSGTYRISNTLIIPDEYSLLIYGEGIGTTRIRWVGADGNVVPMIRFNSGFRNEIRDLQLMPSTNVAKTVSSAIEFYRATGATYAGQNHVLRNVWVGSQSVTYATNAIVMKHDGATDANNDFHLFENVFVNCGTVANVSIQHSQSKAHLFIGCSFTGGQYGVTNAETGNGGSFNWYGGWCGAHSVADFFVQPGDAITIDTLNSEGSNRFLITAGISTNTQPVSIRGVRWANDALNADSYWIVWRNAGPLLVENCYLDGDTTPIPRISVDNGTVNPVSISFNNNGYGMIGSDAITPIVFLGSSGGVSSIEQNSNVFRTLDDTVAIKGDFMRSSAEPTSGYWALQNIVYNTNPTGGGTLGWICTTAGVANATAWAISTGYVVGNLVHNSGKVYRCITSGTSASSGGPTGTGSDITDGTAHWMHLGNKAVFKTFGTISA